MSVIIDGTNGVSTPNTFAFKNRLINAQLEDADGNLMTAEQAKAFVKELP